MSKRIGPQTICPVAPDSFTRAVSYVEVGPIIWPSTRTSPAASTVRPNGVKSETMPEVHSGWPVAAAYLTAPRRSVWFGAGVNAYPTTMALPAASVRTCQGDWYPDAPLSKRAGPQRTSPVAASYFSVAQFAEPVEEFVTQPVTIGFPSGARVRSLSWAQSAPTPLKEMGPRMRLPLEPSSSEDQAVAFCSASDRKTLPSDARKPVGDCPENPLTNPSWDVGPQRTVPSAPR